ncbi:glycoside hydrolase family 95 protein [Thermoanaerobacterium sp. RBIITD]|uniref:glycoside hydrolase family 95 protein n=1 Tax=Thermoanaerobacterium sp. RBIITD TaxID=1550240 RepID=UPI000BB8716C|nr:glycoside hydrolase family 95 protein [Thermoanaerobacterium sp. RBIITD]SNX53393.1 alpha-L-fucosidase 2 [Thermoanaerobacterium sp. RBIITD]
MQDDLKISFNSPAIDWNIAIPIGNGRLGAMVYGTIKREIVQLNEESIWSGGPLERINKDAKKYLSKIRELILNGQIKKAEEISLFALTGTPPSQGHYEPLGFLYIDSNIDEDSVKNYRRELDLKNAIVKVEYKVGNEKFTREYFASYPDDVIVIKLTSSKANNLTFKINLRREKDKYVDRSGHIGDDTIYIEKSNGGKNGLSFCGMVKAVVEDGKVYSIGETLIVVNATTVFLLISSMSTYREIDYFEKTLKTLKNAARKGYNNLLLDHIEDYNKLFNRVSFQLGNKDDNANKIDIDISERLQRLKDGEIDLGLIALYFQFGRYLLISSSRKGSLPSNLQGIWNKDMMPSWDSKYTININTEMNYWPAEICDLSECHLPLFDLIEKMRKRGSKTAKEMYGCRGFCAHHNTDIWGDTAPQDVYMPATYWPMGAAWLCLNIWDYYEYTGDIEFLKSHYNTMKDAALFLLDYMIEDKNGHLVTCPSLSPENKYVLQDGNVCCLTYAPTMDIQIIKALFERIIKTAKILNEDFDFIKELEKAMSKLPHIQIGKYGQIQEWIEDYEEAEPGHRHISHLFGLYPESQITKEKDPVLFEAAKKTLERRLSFGSGHTGWSRAWIICLYARLNDGEKAYQNILELLKNSTLHNLLDNHPPFQIDGNFGAIAGIAEMLLQSHDDILEILPALPLEWEDGCISGLKARGGHKVSIEWENRVLKVLTIEPGFTNKVYIRYKNKTTDVNFDGIEKVKLDSNLKIIKQ